MGTEPVFSAVLVVTLALALVAGRMPEPGLGQPQHLGDVVAAISSRPVLAATWYVAGPSVLFGVVSVLVPLRIDELGGGAGLVATGFAAGAALEAVLAPLVGRFSDRAGRLLPYTTGMLICAATILLVPVADALGVLIAALIAISLGAGLCFAPAMAMLSDSAEATELHQGFSAGLTNMAWAAGQVAGSAGGGAAAGAAGDALPCLLAAGWLLLTGIAAWRTGEGGGLRPAAQASTAD